MESTMNFIDFKKNSNFPFLLLAIGIIVIVYLGLGMHPLEKHPTDSIQVENCLNSNGALFRWTRPTDNRSATVCEISPNTWGIKIDESNGENVTAFIKNKFKRLDQVIQYLINSGYAP